MKRAEKKSRPSLTYADACELAAVMDYWTVEDAAALLLGEIPPGLSCRKLPAAEARRVAATAHIISGAACVMNPESPIGRFRVPPCEFIEWAQGRDGIDVPGALKTAVLGAKEEMKKKKTHIRESTYCRERCKAVAALLWNHEENKLLTLEDMARRPEFLQHGCGGVSYKHDTIKDWIKEQNPNRTKGRRPNNK